MKVSSSNEYGKLKSCIVGTATHANFPAMDRLFQLQMSQAGWKETPPPRGPVHQQIIDETNEDLEKLADVLVQLGVNVLRPHEMNYQEIDSQYGYCPRDNLLVLGDTVIAAPMSTASRQHEMDAYKTIKQGAINSGANWIEAPAPGLSYKQNITDDGDFKLNNIEPVFDAANICRFDDHLLYLNSSSANSKGAEWLDEVTDGKYNIHITRMYDAAHIDSTIVPISEDTLVLNGNRVTDENLPSFLKDYNKIYINDDMITPQDFYQYPYASKWIAINMLAVGDGIVICDAHQPLMIETLMKQGFTVIPMQLRHARTLGGGFHCVTLDLERE